jgi:hypothetical protein
VAFLGRTAGNVVLVVLAAWLLPRGDGDISVTPTLFFLTLISLVTTLHDRWFPVHTFRVDSGPDDEVGPSPRSGSGARA